MEHLGRVLIFAGMALVVGGALLWLLGRTGFRGLPGDMRYESDGLRVYFPIATSIALSVLLTLGIWAWQRLKK
jgi:hypothetical protein